MKSCGVIVEYNPFHNGHRYHLESARNESQADIVIAIMSGNFLQRGEPALIDKWTRANQALENGADLVIQLPFAYAVQSADYFAQGGVRLLQALSVDGLCFGTDSQESVDYQAFAEFEEEHTTEINQAFQRIKNNGMSYPQQMTAVFRELYPELPLDFSSPNHILGMAYAKANQRYDNPMKLYPIQRQQASFHEPTITNQSIASATAIRQAVLGNQWDQIKRVVPHRTFQDLQENVAITWEQYWVLLQYQLKVTTPEKLAQIYQMMEGIEYRLLDAVKKASSFKEFMTLVKTKRFTWTRIQRLLTYSLIQVTAVEIEQSWQESYLHVLGFNQIGRKFLNDRRKSATLPIITNVKREHESLLALDLRSDAIYQLGNPQIKEQNYGQAPIIK